MGDIERFWSKVDVRGPDECWPWTGGRRPTGYGRFYTSERSGAFPAHRWLLGYLRGRPLEGDGPGPGTEEACHRCDNRACCNPAHLYVGDRRGNMGDAVERKRFANSRKERCPKGHKYTQYANRRRCGVCENTNLRVARRARRAR